MTPEPLPLRAHHLLCAEEFRGLGYTQKFAANFARILEELNGRPGTPVRLIEGPDAICAACPWSSPEGCLRGDEGEKAVSRLDELVCARLGLEPGAVMSWADLGALLASRADRAWRLSVCRDCSWFNTPCYREEGFIW
ncbi:MAG: DUF1284 domain-containing protein [Firmicutes bacterium]|nr:DUF1284 domain-containing protein [Bacillota bacterium]